jgi:general secretion pathway protein A
MYERYYGLRERPFNLTSNPRYLMLTPQHAEGLSTLQYGISHRLGIVVLVGEAGTGKTTVIRAAVASQTTGRFVLVNNPLLSRHEFFEHVARGFGLSDDAMTSKTRFLSELTQVLGETAQQGIQTALIVDEAHALPYEILEEVRLLANIETDEEKLLPVVLAGQPELTDRLNETNLRQLKQRIALRCSLGSLRIRETAAYIAGRIRVAGGDAGLLFTPEAVELIHQCSRGLPRTISVICDNALVAGFAADERPVGAATVGDVCRDLDLAVPERAPAIQPTPAQAPAFERLVNTNVTPSEAVGQPALAAARGKSNQRLTWRLPRPFRFRS